MALLSAFGLICQANAQDSGPQTQICHPFNASTPSRIRVTYVPQNCCGAQVISSVWLNGSAFWGTDCLRPSAVITCSSPMGYTQP